MALIWSPAVFKAQAELSSAPREASQLFPPSTPEDWKNFGKWPMRGDIDDLPIVIPMGCRVSGVSIGDGIYDQCASSRSKVEAISGTAEEKIRRDLLLNRARRPEDAWSISTSQPLLGQREGMGKAALQDKTRDRVTARAKTHHPTM